MTNVTSIRGDTFVRSYKLVDTFTRLPINLTNHIVKSHFRNTAGALILDATQLITVDAEDGLITLVVPASITKALNLGSYLFDIELTYPSGTVSTIEQVRLNLIEDYTYE